MGHRPLERWRQEHRGSPEEAQDRLQDHRIAGLLLRVVGTSPSSPICGSDLDGLYVGTSTTTLTFRTTSFSQISYPMV